MNYTLAILKKLEQEFLASIPDTYPDETWCDERILLSFGTEAFLKWLEAREAMPRIVVYERTASWTSSKTYFIYKVTNGVKELLGDEDGYRMQMRAKRDADEFANKLGLKVYWE